MFAAKPDTFDVDGVGQVEDGFWCVLRVVVCVSRHSTRYNGSGQCILTFRVHDASLYRDTIRVRMERKELS